MCVLCVKQSCAVKTMRALVAHLFNTRTKVNILSFGLVAYYTSATFLPTGHHSQGKCPAAT